MEPRTKEAADSIAQKMFTHRLYFDDKKVRYVIVRHSQMESEETYTCVQGVAYPRIYTEDAAILFQDDKQRRYSATVDYSLKKTMDEDGAVRKVLALGVDEPGVLLHYCESHELDKDNLDIFQRSGSIFKADGLSGIRPCGQAEASGGPYKPRPFFPGTGHCGGIRL